MWKAFTALFAINAAVGLVNRTSLQGDLGQSQIGMTLLVKDGDTTVRGHYFYAKYLKDIPLTGTIQASDLTLYAEGGTFKLHFVGNGSHANQPLNFQNSVGLAGEWSNGGRPLFVKLQITNVVQTSEDARWYEQVTAESDAAFEARVQDFKRAVLAGERVQAARFIGFPLRVNQAGKSRMVRSGQELSKLWEQIFTPAYLAQLKAAAPHDLFVRNGQAMLGDGIAWFGAKGAQTVNVP